MREFIVKIFRYFCYGVYCYCFFKGLIVNNKKILIFEIYKLFLLILKD